MPNGQRHLLKYQLDHFTASENPIQNIHNGFPSQVEQNSSLVHLPSGTLAYLLVLGSLGSNLSYGLFTFYSAQKILRLASLHSDLKMSPPWKISPRTQSNKFLPLAHTLSLASSLYSSVSEVTYPAEYLSPWRQNRNFRRI